MLRVLCTGGSGRLGQEVKKLRPDWVYPTREELNLVSVDAFASMGWKDKLMSLKVDGILHLAALTDVPLCEREKERAWTVNVEGTKRLATLWDRHSEAKPFFLMSTPCVFPGRPEEAPFNEDSVPNPANYYGFTKVLQEAIVSCLENYVIFRGNFVPRAPWPFPGAFVDRWGSYLYADTLAKRIIQEIEYIIDSGVPTRTLIHIPGSKKMSMWDLAKLTSPEVKAIYLADYPGPVHLTQDMTLTSNYIDPVEFT